MYDSIIFILLNNIFLGLAFIGWESRYNIDYYILSNHVPAVNRINYSKYSKWCEKHGVIKEPISLPELFLFYFLVIPHLTESLSIISLVQLTI